MSLLPDDPIGRQREGDGYDGWDGRLISLDGTEVSDFGYEDVDTILYQFDTGGWDGFCGAVFTLKDGRYVVYESGFGPTGSGFHADAYGGDADLSFAADLETAIRFGLTDEGRSEMGIVLKDKD